MEEENPIPDPPMTAEEEAMVARMSATELQEIDRMLLSNARSAGASLAGSSG